MQLKGNLIWRWRWQLRNSPYFRLSAHFVHWNCYETTFNAAWESLRIFGDNFRQKGQASWFESCPNAPWNSTERCNCSNTSLLLRTQRHDLSVAKICSCLSPPRLFLLLPRSRQSKAKQRHNPLRRSHKSSIASIESQIAAFRHHAVPLPQPRRRGLPRRRRIRW